MMIFNISYIYIFIQNSFLKFFSESRTILLEMIAQLLEAHPHSHFVHLGCGEVRHPSKL